MEVNEGCIIYTNLYQLCKIEAGRFEMEHENSHKMEGRRKRAVFQS